jgi:hypothetical protein
MAAETLGEVGINVVPVIDAGAFQREIDRQTSGLTFKTPTSKGSTGLSGVSKEVSDIRAELAKLGGTKSTGEVKKVGEALKSMGKEAALSRSGVGGLAGELGAVAPVAGAAAIAIGALAAGATFAAKSFIAAVDQARQFQRIAGGTLDEASTLAQAFEDVGVSSEAGARAMAMLTKNLDTKAFAKAGLEAAKYKSGAADVGETLLKVSAAYKATGDSAKKANILQAAFGRGGQDVAKLLDRGPEGIKALREGCSHRQGTPRLMG